MLVNTVESLAQSADERYEELIAISSIYPDELEILSPFSALFTLPVTPRQKFSTLFSESSLPISFSHLPSIKLIFELPEGYPSKAPPIIRFSTSPSWLPRNTVQKLAENCIKLWEDAGKIEIIFEIIDTIRSHAEQGFAEYINQPLCLDEVIKSGMVEFDRKRKVELFNQESFFCDICQCSKNGYLCYALRSCAHVFCRECLDTYFTSLIEEGNVSQIRCVDQACVKSLINQNRLLDGTRQAQILFWPTIHPSELEEIGIAQDLLERYVWLKKKRALENDPSTMYCPRKWCQEPVRSSLERLDETIAYRSVGHWLEDHDAPTPLQLKMPNRAYIGSEGEEALEKLQICSACEFAFCRCCLGKPHAAICHLHSYRLTRFK
jgi:E3 ubiquitin-protein ligase RNF14